MDRLLKLEEHLFKNLQTLDRIAGRQSNEFKIARREWSRLRRYILKLNRV